MNDLEEKFGKLLDAVLQSINQVKVNNIQSEINDLEKQTMQAGFWNDQNIAKQTTKKIAKLKNRIEPWQNLQKQLSEAVELANLNDESLADDLTSQYEALQTTYEKLKKDLLYGGKYDDYDVILSIHSGAGGVDAQDWAEMILRMYTRWAEAKTDYSVEMIESSVGEEAGIKSATLEISGSLAYGKLKGEQGVHRLVRLSPYNADNLRQTSFAKVEVMPKIDQPEEVVVDEKDIKIDVFRAGGHGGQSVNTTDSAVRVTHTSTGIVVAIQNERSQLQNKETALTILRSKLVQLQLEQHKDKISELKGPNEQASWGNQIRSYVLHPYNMVKDLRTRFETADTKAVLDGKIDPFIEAYLEWQAAQA
jgi:peptide chain release factor 2